MRFSLSKEKILSEFYPVYLYSALVLFVTLSILFLSGIIPAKKSLVKSKPYESGIQTETNLFEERFPLRHYLVALIFLVFDIEVIFLYPWAVVAKKIGVFAFYEILFFLVAILVGFAYIWRKGGLEWE